MTITALRPSPGLLVSVRNVAEAHAALEGGAALIDVKEPAHGPLGRADTSTIAAVLATVAGRRPVSAALGELLDDRGEAVPPGLSFVKWGLAGHALESRPWRTALESRRGFGPDVVAVAYADWQCARAPALDDVFAFAARRSGSVLLVDTHCKQPARHDAPVPTLLDWLRLTDVADLVQRCRSCGVRVALAGSLGPAEIAEIAPLQPDWIAVRGAACDGGRDGEVRGERVRELAQLIRRAAQAIR